MDNYIPIISNYYFLINYFAKVSNYLKDFTELATS